MPSRVSRPATFVCVFFLGPALLSDGLASIGPADAEAATQEFSIGAGSGKAMGFAPGPDAVVNDQTFCS
jgi:hypothetical protein